MSGNSMQREVEPAVLEKNESAAAAVQSDQTLQNNTIITANDKPLMSDNGSFADASTSVSSDSSHRDSTDTRTGSTSITSVTDDSPKDVELVESPQERREDEVPAKEKKVISNNDVAANDSPATGQKNRKAGKESKGGITIDGKKRYPCPFPGCAKTFSTSGHSSRHSRIHTGEKPYRCSYPGCGAQFSRYDNSLQHYRTHIISSKGGKKFRGKGSASAGKVTEDSPLVFKPNPDRGYASEPSVLQPTIRKESDTFGYASPSAAFSATAVPAIPEPELALSKEYYEVPVGNDSAAVDELQDNSTPQAHAAFDNKFELPSKGMSTDHTRPKKICSHTTETTMNDTPKFGFTDSWPDPRMHGVSSEANLRSMSEYSHGRMYSPRDVYTKHALSYETLRSHNILQNRKRLKSSPGYIYPPSAQTNGGGAYSVTGTSDTFRANATGLGSKASTLGYPNPDRNGWRYSSRWQLRIPPTRTGCESPPIAFRPMSYQMRKSGSLPSLLSLDMPRSESSSCSLSKYSLGSESPSVVNPMPVEPANGTPTDMSATKLSISE